MGMWVTGWGLAFRLSPLRSRSEPFGFLWILLWIRGLRSVGVFFVIILILRNSVGSLTT